MLDGLYCNRAGVPVFHEVRGPTAAELEMLLSRIIQRIVKLLIRTGYLIEEQGMRYLAEADSDCTLTPEAGGGLHLSHRAHGHTQGKKC